MLAVIFSKLTTEIVFIYGKIIIICLIKNDILIILTKISMSADSILISPREIIV